MKVDLVKDLFELHKLILEKVIERENMANQDDFLNESFFSEKNNLVEVSYNILLASLIKYKILCKFSPTDFWEYFFTNVTSDDFSELLKYQVKNILGDVTNYELICWLEDYHVFKLNNSFSYKNGIIWTKKSKTTLKSKGAFYTPNKITNYISVKTIDKTLLDWVSLSELKILDFGCGTGRFIIEAMEHLKNSYNIDYVSQVEKHIYAVDIDEIALDITKLKIISLIENIKLSNIKRINEIIVKKNMLIDWWLYDNNSIDFKKLWINVIISNPPYYQLKVNSSDKLDEFEKKYNDELKIKIQNEVEYFRKSGAYSYAIEWMLNYYKLSIEKMIQILSHDWYMWIICPSTIFWDLNAKKLRKHMLLDHKVSEINYYSEGAWLFDWVSQSTVVFFLKKDSYTDQIEIWESDWRFNIWIDTVRNSMWENYEIPYIEKIWRNILKKLEKYPKIANIKNIRNKRWELDLTLHKDYVTIQNTWYNLIRGNLIWENGIKYDKTEEFVDIERFKKTKSDEYLNNDFNKVRLICNQISNIDTKKRLKFVSCSEKDIIGNSCNYITLIEDKNIEKLKTLLNSFLLNWRFIITSSNNHINNYELDELPISEKFLQGWKKLDNIISQNILICKYYDLSIEECLYILNPFFNSEEILQNAKEIYL